MDIISKDVYEYLTNFADDKTILNMLSINKKFSDEQFFEKVMKRKYPLLVKFKNKEETWKQFFLRMTHYIYKIEEKYKIPYIPADTYNPYEIYKKVKNIKKDYERKIDENPSGKVRLENRMIDRIYNQFLLYAVKAERKDLVDLILTKGTQLTATAFRYSVSLDFLQYLLTKARNMNLKKKWLLEALKHAKDLDTINYIDKELDKLI